MERRFNSKEATPFTWFALCLVLATACSDPSTGAEVSDAADVTTASDAGDSAETNDAPDSGDGAGVPPSQAATPPSFGVPAGNYDAPFELSLWTPTPSASIFYTLDGSTPTSVSPLYAQPILIDTTVSVSAKAMAADLAPSLVSSATYVLPDKASAPFFSPPSGTYTSSQKVVIASTTPGATIYYTVDGSAPDATASVYATALEIAKTTTLRSMATAEGFIDSNIAEATYTINLPVAAAPMFDPPGGHYTQSPTVTMDSATPGAKIHFTKDGTDPTASSETYYYPEFVFKSSTLKAIAIAPNHQPSPISTAVYEISPGDPLPSPVITPNGGTFDAPVTFTITTNVSNGMIVYTLDGTLPGNESGSQYLKPMTLYQPTTVTAMVFQPGETPSLPTVAVFDVTIDPPPCVAPPTIAPGTGVSNEAIHVTLTSTNQNAVVCYTLDGTEPECSSYGYCEPFPACMAYVGGPIEVNETGITITARSCLLGMASCGISAATYTLKAATPSLLLTPGTPTPLAPPTPNFIVSTAEMPSSIRFYVIPTGDTAPVLECGGSPTPGVTEVLSNSTMVYVTGGQTVGAIACKEHYEASDIVVADYPVAQ